MGYLGLAAKGVGWVGAFRASTRAVSLLRTLVLARILSPSQFGIFAIASMTIVFLEILTETGVNVVLIQKKQGIEKYLNTAWMVSIFRGILISIVLLISAPFISSFFGSPEALKLIYLISLVSFIRGFINPAIVRFQKEMRFSQEFWFRFIIFSFDSLVAVFMAYLLKSEIGIVIGLIAGALLELLLSFMFVKPWPKLEFEAKKLAEVLSKGKWITGAGLFQFIFKQGDDAVVGRILGESSLGIYQVAYKISSMPISEITDVFARVTFPLYVKIAHNKKSLRSAFIKTTVAISLLAVALGAIIFIFGEYVIVFLLGSKWYEAISLIKVLSVYGVIQAIGNSVNSLLLAIEKQHLVTLITLVQVAVLLISIFPLIAAFGLWGASLAPLLGAIIGLPLMAYFAFKNLHD